MSQKGIYRHYRSTAFAPLAGNTGGRTRAMNAPPSLNRLHPPLMFIYNSSPLTHTHQGPPWAVAGPLDALQEPRGGPWGAAFSSKLPIDRVPQSACGMRPWGFRRSTHAGCQQGKAQYIQFGAAKRRWSWWRGKGQRVRTADGQRGGSFQASRTGSRADAS